MQSYIASVFVVHQVSTNGILSLGQEYSSHIPSTPNIPIIAPLWVDLDFRSGGTIYYRITDDLSTLNLIGERIRDGNEELRDYTPTQAVVVTWFKSPAFNNNISMVCYWLISYIKLDLHIHSS